MTDSGTTEKGGQSIREGYSKIAKDGIWLGRQLENGETDSEDCCEGGSCCGGLKLQPEELAKELGYNTDELKLMPEEANMGLSCGNPAAIAALKHGEVVVDLGSGGGFDVFLAGPKVGKTGRVIGVDMTPDMLEKARRNAEAYRERTGFDNVEFRLGEIEYLPVGDAQVDVMISNCVLNLSSRKQQVWDEMYRVLKPGGRVAVSDMALLKPLPEALMNMMACWVGCVAGAVLIKDTETMAGNAGFSEISIVPKSDYVRTLMDSGDPLYARIQEELPAGLTPADYITSADISAVKPV